MFLFGKTTETIPTKDRSSSVEDIADLDNTTEETTEETSEETTEETTEETSEEKENSDNDSEHDSSDSDRSEYSDSVSDYSSDNTSNYVEDSEVYVITADNVPKCYTYSLGSARSTMWKVARIIKNKNILYNTLYNTIISEINLDKIQVIGKHNFSIVHVDKVLSSLEIHKIGRLLSIKSD